VAWVHCPLTGRYADAPFVFDVYLNPTKFPHDPPIVHFHSHTFGKGRCNRESGVKWSNKKTDAKPTFMKRAKCVCQFWAPGLATSQSRGSEFVKTDQFFSADDSPAKSSLLQVFVSISGLVLVRSPYHCEPAFAKLEGTKEGKVNS